MRSLKVFLCAAALIVLSALACSADAAEVGTVNANGGLRLRSDASTSSSTIATVENGAELVITELGTEWSKVNYAGTEGYMSTAYLDHSTTADFTAPITGKVTASVLNIRSTASTDGTAVGQVTSDTYVWILGVTDGWYHIKTTGGVEGYVHPDYLFPVTAYLPSQGSTTTYSGETSSTRAALISFAKQYIGTRYTYGGKSPSAGFDCSGFVYYVFKQYGYTLNPGASNQMNQVTVINRASLQPGDLVFFNDGSATRASHVGIYIGGDQFIHAVRPGKTLTITSMNESYYSKYFVGGGRVLPV